MGLQPNRGGFPPNRGGYQNQGANRPQGGRPEITPLNTTGIDLCPAEGKALNPDLFDGIAQRVAKDINESDRFANKPAQIRQFYDELVMWEEKARQNPERFADYLPFIRMLNAKAAYAEGRKHVNRTFVDFMAHGLKRCKTRLACATSNSFSKPFWDFTKRSGRAADTGEPSCN